MKAEAVPVEGYWQTAPVQYVSCAVDYHRVTKVEGCFHQRTWNFALTVDLAMTHLFQAGPVDTTANCCHRAIPNRLRLPAGLPTRRPVMSLPPEATTG